MTEFRPGGFQILPPVVKNLIIINALMGLLQFALIRFNINIQDYLALHYWHSELYKPWQLVTHMFLHGSPYSFDATLWHFISNMFALWMFGNILENVWGPGRFLTFYLVCGIGAALLHLGVVGYEFRTLENAFTVFQQNPTLDKFDLIVRQHSAFEALESLRLRFVQDPSLYDGNDAIAGIHQYLYGFMSNGVHEKGILDAATVGASGAVFGILFAFGYLFPNTLLHIYFLVPIKAKYVVGAYALFELFAGIRNSAGDNVAHFAHLGGMLVAFIILKIWDSRNKNRTRFYR
jgi:membrane associated rhomboid family serine protease